LNGDDDMSKVDICQIAEGKLKSEGYKLTNQRKAILKSFETSDSHLLSAQQLFAKVIEICPGTNFSTIYRNLELLTSIGIISRVELGDGIGCYELKLENDHHHHLICLECGDTRVIDYCPLAHIEEKSVYEGGFTPVKHRFDIYGYCYQCKKAKRD